MTGTTTERAILVAVEITAAKKALAAPATAFDAAESLAELSALAESAGAEVLDRVLQSRPSFDQTTLIGAGKLDELKTMVRALEADTVIFDHELGGTQQRNLEKVLECKVLDRTQLILDIFARRAHTREGQLQVELAQLSYLLPRLTGRGAAMSRLGGGIGTRGPGETQLETDRRRIRTRIRKLEDQLDTVRSSRSVRRGRRQAVPLQGVALVGYTNAGKSTLFNLLTRAGVLADARMFATLDPTVRQLVLPSRRRVVLSDTVGFIRQLPTTLVKAFRATLEEVSGAALLLHVVDASSPHAAAHISHVTSVLNEIGAGGAPQVLVLNKADALEEDAASVQRRLAGGMPSAVISARDGSGVDGLLGRIDRMLPQDHLIEARFRIPHNTPRLAHLLHEYADVMREEYTGDAIVIDARVPESLLPRVARYRVKNA